MDVFPDEILEHILGYLPFKDKIIVERVSKQWQRCVYNKQFSLMIFAIDFYATIKRQNLSKLVVYESEVFRVNTKALESVLKKCPNIRRIEIGPTVRITEEVLSLIGVLCPQLMSLKFKELIEEKHLSFAEKYGHKLQETRIIPRRNDRLCKKFLYYCPNIKNISLHYFIPFDGNKEFLPKLESIDSLRVFPEDVQHFEKICEKYSKTMKSIDVTLKNMTDEDLKTCLLSICHLKNLKTLSLKFCESGNEEPIDEYISMIGHKCIDISRLSLTNLSSVPITDQFLDSYSSFQSLISLNLNFNVEELKGDIKSLSGCSQLKHLDIRKKSLTKDFFVGIDTTLPNLQTLKLVLKEKIPEEISDSFIEPFLEMKFIEKVRLEHCNKHIDEWYFGKQLDDLEFRRDDIILINANCGLIQEQPK